MPRPRPRSICKWACTTLALLLVAITLASKWWNLTWAWNHLVNGSRSIEVGGGTIEVTWFAPQTAAASECRIERIYVWQWGWSRPGPQPVRLSWQYGFMHLDIPTYRKTYGMTLLYPTLLTTLAAALLWRPDFRKRAGHCPTCNYNLRGLPTASPCPECGHSLSSPS